MAKVTLDFERPIIELEQKIVEMRKYADNLDIADEIATLENKVDQLRENVYNNLTRWQRVQLARHPDRPYTLDYIPLIAEDFIELHGDRRFGDDKAIVAGFCTINKETVLIVGHQKGRDTRSNIYRNFGMPNPEGYRKALRLMQLAAKFQRPIICLLDTPGAYPGIGAEERGQGEAIARNLFEMSHLPVPIIIVIIGEGASGGALGIGVGDRILMFENAWYSVISPESCSSILWRNWEYKEQAAEALKLTAPDLLEQGVIDRIIPEPMGGAHRNPQIMAQTLKNTLLEELKALKKIKPGRLVELRVEKFSKMGAWKER
ncbi:MAG: acetyl-CoA carboxylase carboxyltransferase subunit alpha [Bacteroidota bacterium]